MSGNDGWARLSDEGSEGERLACWARAVRRSTLRRLASVPRGLENLAAAGETMSFADLAQHLIDADAWLERKLSEPRLPAMRGRAGSLSVDRREAWEHLLEELGRSGRRRERLLEGLDEAALARRLRDERFDGEASVWWIVVRGNLEYEAHHRGQIGAALRVVADRPVERS